MMKIKFLICALFGSLAIGLGSAAWVYSADENKANSANVYIGHFNFEHDWTDSDLLPEEGYEQTCDFEYAINNPSSEQGTAWINAWDNKNTKGNSYVGTMDNRVGNDLAAVFNYPPETNIIVTRSNQNEFYVYITYEELNSATGTIAPVYETKFYREHVDNQYEPIQTWVGRCNRNTYSTSQKNTYSFDPFSFVEA